MEIKAVFFDIDGTFFDHHSNQVLPETMDAIRQLKANGYKVALCSGRAKEMAEQLGVLQLFPWDGYVGGAGVSVYDEQMNIIFEDTFTAAQCERIFALGKEYDICINSHGKYEFMTKPLNAYSKAAFDQFHCQVPIVREWDHEPLVALSAYEKPGFDWHMFDGIEGIEVQHPSLTCVDFMKTSVNKARGIAHLMKYWQLPAHAYLAFGDSMNDLQMIQEAGIGVVMGNGHEELKIHADEVIGPSWEPSLRDYLLMHHYIDDK